jgi:hypothetical protein
MTHRCFISFKKEDEMYKKEIQNHRDIDMIDKSLDEPIDSNDEDYIMKKIREDYLSDSTVTIHLIGSRSAESLGSEEQKYIKRELQASLYDGENNNRSGILGVVLPSMYDQIYLRNETCATCGNQIVILNLGDNTAIKEFHYNYHIPKSKCHWFEDDRYCVMVKWDKFMEEPNKYIEEAFAKREHPISKKIKVRP